MQAFPQVAKQAFRWDNTDYFVSAVRDREDGYVRYEAIQGDTTGQFSMSQWLELRATDAIKMLETSPS